MYHWRQNSIQQTLRSASLLALLAFGTGVSAQVNTSAPVADDSGVATLDQESFSGGVSLRGTYFDVRHQTNSGVGYRGGFTQFGVFAPIWGSEDWYVAPNVRMTLTDDTSVGFNAGAVARRYSERYDRIFGVNAFYDDDISSNNFRYQQFGFGAETLGTFFDARANGYVPTTHDDNFVAATGLSTNLVFFENRLGFIGTQLVERSLAGGDAEVGAPLAPDMPWLRGYVGAYAYRQNDGSTPVGYRARVEGWLSNDLSVGAMITSDEVFGTNVNFTADWRFAGLRPTRFFPNWSTRDRMMMPVNRQWRVSTNVTEELVNVAGENPRDGQQYFVVWVDPDSTAVDPGTGTFEDPFHHQLTDGVPNETDLVMVRRGDTTELAPLDSTITLPDFARMLGEGKTHIADVSLTTGPFAQFLPIVNMGPNNLPLPGVNDAALPGAEFTNTGLYPFLTNSGGNIINVGNHNEVSALVLMNATGAAIAGNNTSGFHFNHLEINGNLGGIVLTQAHGTGSVSLDGQTINSGLVTDINRNLVPDWSFVGTGIGNNGVPGGISIATGVAPLELTLSRVSMNSDPGLQDFGVRLMTEQGRLTAILQDVTASGGNVVAGVSLEQKSGQFNATIDTLDASDNLGNGLQLLSGNLRPMTVDGINVTANGNTGDNLFINNNPAALPPFHNSTFTASFTDSTFDSSTGGNGISLGMTNGTKSLTLTNVSASANALMGLDLQATGGTLNFTADGLIANENNDTNLNIGLTDANFVGNVTSVGGPSLFNESVTGSGIVLTATGGRAFLGLDTIFADGNAVDGVQITALGGAQIGNSANLVFDGVNIHDSSLSGNGGIGLNQFADGASHLEVFVDPTDISGNGNHNVRFEVLGGSTFAALYDQTTMENSGTGNGLLGLVDGTDSVANVLVRDSSITGSADDGVYLGTTDNGVASLTLTNVNVQDSGFSTAGASGIELNGASGSTINLVLDGNLNGTTVVNNTVIGGPAAYGLTVLSEGTGTNVNVTATDTNFDNASANAVDVFVSDNGTAFFDFDGVTATSGVDGLNSFVQSGGTFNACLIDTHFDGFTGAGMRSVTTSAGSITNMHMDGSSADLNGGGGLVADVLNGGELNLRTVNFTSFNENGIITDPTNGVFVNVADTGSTARLLFNETSASGNFGDATADHGNGFKFVASNGAYLTARLDSITANDNSGGYGVRLDASDAGTNAVLIPEGTNTITGNTLGSYSINYTGTDSAIVGLTGSFNNQPTDGVSVNITNVTTALVTLTGDGTDTISNNGDDGVDININMANVVGIRIAGYSDISENDADGIHIELTEIMTAAAIEVLGPTDLTDNDFDNDGTGQGVNIVLTNVALGTFVPPAALDPLSVLTLTDNLNAPLDCLPLPVDLPFDSVVTVPTANGILLDQLTIARTNAPFAGQHGINIDGENVTGLGEILIGANGNTTTITNYDNGINASFTTGSSFGGITIDGATIDQSATSGIALSYAASGTPITINNTAITNSGATGLDIVLTGATGGFDINLANTTVETSGSHGVSITDAGAGSIIGQILMDHVSSDGTSAGGNGVQIALDNAGTSVDAIMLTSVSATNSDAHGILVDLNGVSVGSPIALDGGSDSFATNNGQGGSGDGIRISLTDLATAPDVSVTNYDLDGVLFGIDNNAGNGIAIISSGTTDVGAITVSNNRVNDSTAGDGIRVELVNNVNGDVILDANVVDNSAGDGIRLALDGVTGQNVSTTNSNIDGSGAIGINLTAVGATLGTITLDPSTVSNSQFDGVRIDLTNAIVDALVVEDFTITNSSLAGDGAGTGLNITLDGASVPVVTIDNVSVSNVAVTELMDRGVSISGVGGGLFNPLNVGVITLTDVSSLGGTVNEGVAVTFNADAVANGNIGSLTMNNVSADLSGTTGILVDLSTVAIGSPVSLTGGPNSFSTNNGGDGIRVRLDTVSGTPDVNISDYDLVENNGGSGIVLQTNVTDVGAVTVSNNTVNDSTGGDGIQVSLIGSSAFDSLLMDGNAVTNSSNGGINVLLLNVTGGTPGDVTISDSTVDNSLSGDGVLLLTVGSTLNDVLIEDVSVSNSNGNGVAMIDFGGTMDDITLNEINSDTTTAGQGGSGVTVQLLGTTLSGDIAVTGPGIVNDSDADGVSVLLSGVSGTPDVTVDGYTVDRSGNRGIAIETNGSAVGAVEVSNFAVTDSGSVANNEAQGVLIDLTNSDVGSVLVGSTTTNTIANSAGRGFDLVLDGVTLTNSIDISELDVTDSGLGVVDGGTTGRGVSVAGVGSAGDPMLLGAGTLLSPGLINLTNVTSTNTGAEQGVIVQLSSIDLDTNAKVGDVTLTNVSAFNSFGAGVVTSLTNMTFDPTISILGEGTAQSTGNGGDGILVTVNGVSATPDLDIVVSSYLLVDDNAGHGIAVLTNGNDVGNISITDHAAITNSTNGDGIHLDLTGSQFSGTILVSSNTNIGDSSANGVNLVLDGVTGSPVIDINNTTVSRSGLRGISVTGSGATLGDLLMTGVSSDTTTAATGGEGVAVVLDGPAGTVGSILLNGVSATNSNLDGILIDLDTMTVGPQFVIDGQGSGQITGNGGNGILVDLDTTILVDMEINSNTINTNGDNGLLINQLDSNVGPINLTSNIIDNNGLHGVNFGVDNSAQGVVTLTENQITGHTAGDGVHVENPDTGADVSLDYTFRRNTITGNTGGRGVNFTLPNALGTTDTLNLSFTNDTVDGNGLEGLLVDLTSNATTNVTANIEIHSDDTMGEENPFNGAIASSFSNNTGMGVFLNASLGLDSNTADFNLTIDSNGAGINAFNGNGDAGLGVHLGGGDDDTLRATAVLNVTNGTFNNNVDGANANFGGAGIGILIENDSRFDNSTIDGVTMNGNATNGFSLNTTGIAKSDDLEILNSTITGNMGSGILFNRNAAVPVAATYISDVLIEGNTIETNLRGVEITAAFADGADTYTIRDNEINDNRLSGILLFLTADADLNVDIDDNRITGNGTANVVGDREGIVGFENLGAGDIGVIQALVQNNTIDSNFGAGMNITALHRLTIEDNEITNNTLDGITITGATVPLTGIPFPFVNNTITRNAINDNGGNGITLNAIGRLGAIITDNNSISFGGQGGINRNGNGNSGDGVQLNATSGIIFATLDDNEILNSVGDGIQFLASGTGTTGGLFNTNTVTITDNIVTESGRRGINILNAADTRTTVTIDRNDILFSQREGVYIVNTSTSGTTGVGSASVQGIDALADTTMAVAATHTNDPRLALNINDNVISANGQAANNGVLYDATGLVLRVGTSNATNDFTNNGGFATTAGTTAALADGVTAGELGRGGVAANVTGNLIQGNFANDVTFQAYVSTTALGATGGTWSDANNNPATTADDLFQVTSFVQDPLARLDLRFTASNEGESIIATRSDVFATGTNSAFYNNDESVFKSRTTARDGNDGVGADGSNDGGPFLSGTRLRNAVRLASNAAPFDLPSGTNTPSLSVATNGFLYPGVGESTFRISTDSSITGFPSFLSVGFGDTPDLGNPANGEIEFAWGNLLP